MLMPSIMMAPTMMITSRSASIRMRVTNINEFEEKAGKIRSTESVLGRI
jgi:hypothetical protein